MNVSCVCISCLLCHSYGVCVFPFFYFFIIISSLRDFFSLMLTIFSFFITAIIPPNLPSIFKKGVRGVSFVQCLQMFLIIIPFCVFFPTVMLTYVSISDGVRDSDICLPIGRFVRMTVAFIIIYLCLKQSIPFLFYWKTLKNLLIGGRSEINCLFL